LHGVIKYSNKQLEQLGVNEGDEVCFTPNSEYEFYVDEEKLYRMFTNNIALTL
jgi:co-chaperonin GroES (HSP10)